MKWILICQLFFYSFLSNAQFLKQGQWRGNIHFQEGTVPFTLEVGYPNGDTPQITLINGKERRVINNAIQKGDSLTIPLDPFDVAIKAKFTAMSMEGEFHKYYRGDTFPFSAVFGQPRMTKKSVKSPVPVAERWDITFDPETSNMSKGVGIFEQNGSSITGTILTKVSDYRYLEGMVDGDSIKLSCFDGIHAFMILGQKSENGWKGKIIYDDTYSEPWVAVADPNASLPDPFDMVQTKPGKQRPYYDLLGAGSGKNAIDPTKYEGKVLIIQLFGTWCPNSHDQTTYLVDWYKKNKEKDIAILASSYEANYSQEYGLERIEKYKSVNGIEYDMVLGGRLSKTAAAMPFPFMEKIEAFPTLVIVDKQGYVRYVHSYFNGPATGSYYTEFDDRFNAIIAELLAE